MTAPIKLNFQVYQGSTFKQILRWESATKVYVPIIDVSKSAPIRITAPGHNIPEGWRVRVSNVSGMKEINTGDLYYQATIEDANTLQLNAINSLSYTPYVSGGVVEYNAPVALAAVTGVLKIAENIGSTNLLYEATSQNGGIIINAATNQIILNIPASVTSTFNFLKAVFELSLVSAGDVIPFAAGLIYVERGVSA